MLVVVVAFPLMVLVIEGMVLNGFDCGNNSSGRGGSGGVW